MNLKFSNYGKPSDPMFKKIGDYCLFAIPLYLPLLASLPLNDNLKLWIGGILGFVLATVKIISKFSINSNFQENDTQSTS
jgi:hypothetical protein